MNWQKLYNQILISLLHSPLHSLIDKSTILFTLTGRKSGWKNLRGGAQVTLYIQGHTSKASGEVFTDAETVANKLLLFLQHFPGYQRFIHIKLAANGQPENPEAFQRFAQGMVIVQMKELVEVAA